MRLWSIHPKYLDAKGLVALWREALLAKKVLENKTKGYKNHSQLTRFKTTKYPVDAINQYLGAIYDEAVAREYNFNKTKIDWTFKPSKLTVTKKQLAYEMNHLKNKLKTRDTKKLKEVHAVKTIVPHPLFKPVAGDIESWEII